MQVMKNVVRTVTAGAMATTMSLSAQAADELNVAFFLEWATPNMIAKAQVAYEDALGVNVDDITVVDQVPADAVVSLADGSVDMACIFGGNATKDAREHGKNLMSAEDMTAAGIIAFDVVSVTESFAADNPEMLRTFMQVTNDANVKFAADGEGMDLIMRESGMDEETTTNQMADMRFPTSEEQLAEYFNEGGLAATAFQVVGGAFATPENPAMEDYNAVIDTSFLQ